MARESEEVTAACLKASSSHSTASTARMDRQKDEWKADGQKGEQHFKGEKRDGEHRFDRQDRDGQHCEGPKDKRFKHHKNPRFDQQKR